MANLVHAGVAREYPVWTNSMYRSGLVQYRRDPVCRWTHKIQKKKQYFNKHRK